MKIIFGFERLDFEDVFMKCYLGWKKWKYFLWIVIKKNQCWTRMRSVRLQRHTFFLIQWKQYNNPGVSNYWSQHETIHRRRCNKWSSPYQATPIASLTVSPPIGRKSRLPSYWPHYTQRQNLSSPFSYRLPQKAVQPLNSDRQKFVFQLRSYRISNSTKGGERKRAWIAALSTGLSAQTEKTKVRAGLLFFYLQRISPRIVTGTLWSVPLDLQQNHFILLTVYSKRFTTGPDKSYIAYSPHKLVQTTRLLSKVWSSHQVSRLFHLHFF